MAKKLVLAYVDSLRTDMLRQTIDEGRAPTFSRLLKRGTLVGDCVSSFPSVTPVASAEMVTGVQADQHWISGMNWFHRAEQRYVEYGSSLEATRAFGLFRSLHDLVYNMNLSHLSPSVETVFETLDDVDIRTASTPFLIYRGRHRHEVNIAGITGKAIEAGILKFDYGTWGPRELFYGDLYTSMETKCKPSSIPGKRDMYSACCGAELISRDAFDFMLLAFPDNDNYSHRHGPLASVRSIERADYCMAEVVRAAGGIEPFLKDHALILLADHAHTAVEDTYDVIEWMSRKWKVLPPSSEEPEEAEVAVSPTSRAAHIYLLAEQDNPVRHRRIREHLFGLDGTELVVWTERDGTPVARSTRPGHLQPGNVAVVERAGRRLDFFPLVAGQGDPGIPEAPQLSDAGGRKVAAPLPVESRETVTDRRGREWSISGNLEALGASVENGVIEMPDYPDGLGRLWSALVAPHGGDIIVSVALGYECVDWGGAAHVPGGSHGSLRREDSEGPLLFVGCGPDSPDPETAARHQARRQWGLQDVAPIIHEHFAVS
ncbi:MAG: alkaline phosphatase family protein [Solirubrobacterales bacterium]|nr:alkaline phosphatase family protein [Solirubrobacterales bacterium]MCB0863409.1 alkaline phosphatase family protein [Solirubrobacterales bacterium]MCB8914297.1 alkaline phosphatase family protein [Thermoleophilales bacterium]